MIIVPIKEGDTIDRALKKLKRKFEKTGIAREFKERQKFTKQSVKRKQQKYRAIHIQKIKQGKQ